MNSYQKEFETVDLILLSKASTKQTDAFILTWVKMEKQLRRLFKFFVFYNNNFTEKDINKIDEILVRNKKLNYYSFQKLIEKLLSINFELLLSEDIQKNTGENYEEFYKNLERIKKYRNKILHGQNTGHKLNSTEIEKEIKIIREWIITVGKKFKEKYHYDGLARNTFKKAKAVNDSIQIDYPFNTIPELKQWIINWFQQEDKLI